MGKGGVSLDWGGFDKAIANAANAFELNTKPLMKAIGEVLVSSTIQRFDAEEGPDGTKWTPSERARTEGGKTLTDTARLRDSIDYAATAKSVAVGSNVKYARIHQMGGDIRAKKGKSLSFRRGGKTVLVSKVTMPARPYLGLSADDKEEVKELLDEFLSGAFKG